MTVVLDAGVFIAGARGNRTTLATLRLEAGRALLVTPATAIAEFWRDGARTAAEGRLFNAWQPRVIAVDAPIARRAGAMLGRARSDSTLDAIVVAVAESCAAARILTTDPADIESLLACDVATAHIEVVKVD